MALAGAVAREAPARVIERLMPAGSVWRTRADTAAANPIELIEYPNGVGQTLRAIVNRTSPSVTGESTPVVIMPSGRSTMASKSLGYAQSSSESS